MGRSLGRRTVPRSTNDRAFYHSTNDRATFSVVTATTEHDATTIDGRRLKGRRTRQSILATAVDLASVEGLEGLTIGRLAAGLGMSKSGLFAHFGSKEELQLATIEAARRRFVDHVIRPSRPLPRGRSRLEAMLADLLAYYRSETFP